ncbi:glycosyl transferase, group 2 family protein [mine drainage metagenome]|uniref:Glycosyl transferase, group 2 family protein n=1 Tax=mine drainage metagenome TaxID=410659 RepID=T1CS98_9ZZZZ
MRASMVVPTLNEAGSITMVLRGFRAAAEQANRTIFRDDPIDWEVLVVDGASTDGTGGAAEAEGARVIVERRKGYGRAYRTGFAEASGEIIATSDGDGTYPVEEIPTLVRRLIDERLDFLTGDRLAYVTREAMTTEHRIGNWMLNFSFEVAYHRYVTGPTGTPIHDSQSGLWVFRRSILDRVVLTQDGMAMSEELKIEALTRGFHVLEVPIRYGERLGHPKLSSWRDGVRNGWFLLRKRFYLDREERTAARRAAAR